MRKGPPSRPRPAPPRSSTARGRVERHGGRQCAASSRPTSTWRWRSTPTSRRSHRPRASRTSRLAFVLSSSPRHRLAGPGLDRRRHAGQRQHDPLAGAGNPGSRRQHHHLVRRRRRPGSRADRAQRQRAAGGVPVGDRPLRHRIDRLRHRGRRRSDQASLALRDKRSSGWRRPIPISRCRSPCRCCRPGSMPEVLACCRPPGATACASTS